MMRGAARRRVAMALTTLVAMSTLTACGGDAYCSAVSESTSDLKTFGEKRTGAAYRNYAETFRSVAKVSPDVVREDWAALAKVTEDVLAAQKDVGLKLEEMTDTDAVKELDTAQLKKLNDAYEAFNKTTAQREAVVKNVQQECEIDLEEPAS